jgi:hypothetical protein
MSYVAGISKEGRVHPIGSLLFATCSTASAVQTKEAELADFDAMRTGVTVHVKFQNANTAPNPTLAINGLTAYPIYTNGISYVGPSAALSWAANSVVSLTFDGSAWYMNGWRTDVASASEMGDVDDLTTTARTVVGAINEVKEAYDLSDLGAIAQQLSQI